MRSKRRSRESMAKKLTLPQETLTDILSRLPIKSLTRFESVSKPFSALINSPAFISAHLRRSSRHFSFFVRHFHNPSGSNFCFFLTDTQTTSNQISDVEVPLLGSLIRFPKIVGSCNGLICLDISSCYARGFVLWNIARKQYSCLPTPSIDNSRGPFWMISTGFGFDLEKNDYKVVRIVSFSCEKDETPVVMVEVFSWRTGSWRVLDGRMVEESMGACSIHEGQNGVLVNGGLHWLGHSAGKSGIQKFILSFDLVTEEFRKIPTPDFSAGICVRIMGFKGSLALAFYPLRGVGVYSGYGRAGPVDRVEICVWGDEYGGADGKCWNKLNSIQLSSYGYPVGVANETGLVMRKLEGQFTQFILCDPSNQTSRRLHICEATYSCDIHDYVESLVPVSSGHDHQVKEEEELSEV